MTSQSIKWCCSAALIFSSFSQTHADSMAHNRNTIIFLGDSITQSGDKPGGYVTRVRDTIKTRGASSNVEVLGAGISGNKVPDLEKRLERDVLSKNPTTVVIYIGINDVWHSIRKQGTPKDLFSQGLRSIVNRIQRTGSRVILCTPSVIGEKASGENPLDEMLDDYSNVTRTISQELGTGLIDLRASFRDHLAQINTHNFENGVLTTDGVHLNEAGNAFVAKKMLEGLGISRHLRHVVMFKFKEDSTPTDIQTIIDAFSQLPYAIKEIQDFEWGTDISPEGKSKGFTHCFIVTFKNESDRDAYLPHPAHKKFVEIVGPHVEDVCVVDFWTEPRF